MNSLDFPYIGSLLVSRDFWSASIVVIALSISSWSLSVFLGMFVALAQQSRLRSLRYPAAVYIWFFRSLPLLVLLILVYNAPQLFPSLAPVLSQPFWAGLIALVLNETAYIAEIHRGGLLGVPRGQHEAGRALGIRFFGRLGHIIAPQAFRIALPSLANEFVTIVKMTSLVSVISLTEILLVGQRLYTQNFKVIDTLIAVAIYYVFIVSLFNIIIGRVERWLNVYARNGAMTMVDTGQNGTVPAQKSTRKTQLSQTPFLKLSGILKSYGPKTVLNGIDLDIREGEVVSIIGPSGSGKTTLIRTINGLESFNRGKITLDGQEWIQADDHGYKLAAAFEDRVTQVGMVFQSFNLFPHMTVLGNVTLGPRYHKSGTRAVMEADAMAALAKVGMAEHAGKYPHQLSGGQQQRVAIARALSMKPQVMLFDEPTSALDPELVNEVLGVIERLAAEGTTMLIVTHEMRFALGISDRIVFMENGRIEASGSPSDLLAAGPEARVTRFLSHSGQR